MQVFNPVRYMVIIIETLIIIFWTIQFQHIMEKKQANKKYK